MAGSTWAADQCGFIDHGGTAAEPAWGMQQSRAVDLPMHLQSACTRVLLLLLLHATVAVASCMFK